MLTNMNILTVYETCARKKGIQGGGCATMTCTRAHLHDIMTRSRARRRDKLTWGAGSTCLRKWASSSAASSTTYTPARRRRSMRRASAARRTSAARRPHWPWSEAGPPQVSNRCKGSASTVMPGARAQRALLCLVQGLSEHCYAWVCARTRMYSSICAHTSIDANSCQVRSMTLEL
jgi:hypothetical protein